MKLINSIKGLLKLKKQLPADIVFYSESKAYYTNFKDIIDELINKYNQKVIYVSSDINDKVFNISHNNFIPIYIESNTILILFFNYLKSKVLVTTMPDIDTFHLKRSPYVKNMIYVNHSIVSMNMIYLPRAFESYDTICAVGSYHEKEIREMEQEYNTKPKKIIKAGYPALDDFIKGYNSYIKNNENNNHTTTITIAPSWQENNIIDLCIYELIDVLLPLGYLIKLRPHPMTIKYEYGKIENIIKHYKNQPNFSIDNSLGNFASYMDTDLMITDWSGTVFKYSFTTLKPVIFINTPIKVRNNNYLNYENKPVEISWRNQLGKSCDIDKLDNIKDMVQSLLNDNIFKDKIMAFRNENIYNINKSGTVCAEYIMDYIKNN